MQTDRILFRPWLVTDNVSYVIDDEEWNEYEMELILNQ